MRPSEGRGPGSIPGKGTLGHDPRECAGRTAVFEAARTGFDSRAGDFACINVLGV